MRWRTLCLGYLCQWCRWCFSSKQINGEEICCIWNKWYSFGPGVILCSCWGCVVQSGFIHCKCCVRLWLFLWCCNSVPCLFMHWVSKKLNCLNSSDIIFNWKRLLDEFDLQRHTLSFIWYNVTRTLNVVILNTGSWSQVHSQRGFIHYLQVCIGSRCTLLVDWSTQVFFMVS